ncbi:MAG: VWA domain-containing protein, partial [Acidimicrobiales bacterium]
ESAGRVAIVPTALAAASRRGGGASTATDPLVELEDVQEIVSEQRLSNLVVLCVDASGSMGAAERVASARQSVMRLLTDAYERRDRVAVVSFSGEGARVVLRPTGSVEVARQRLGAVPTGGRTPLGEGILGGLEVCSAPSARAFAPVLVIVSDGRATGAPAGVDPVRAALDAASRVRTAGIPALFVDVESDAVSLGLGEEVAEAMGARHVRLARPDGAELDLAVRSMLS